jgi:ribosomal protein L15
MPVMPIAFYMIILRLSYARKQLTKSGGGSSGGFGSQGQNQASYALRPVRIQIATQQVTDERQLGKQGSSDSHPKNLDDFEMVGVSKHSNVV